MEESTIIYDEFISKFKNQEINLYLNSFKAVLLNSNYIPDKKDCYKNMLIDNSFKFEINADNYLKGGILVDFEKKVNKSDALFLSGGNVHFYNLTTGNNINNLIRYMLIYRVPIKEDEKGLLIMCQNLGSNLILENDDLILSWDPEPILSLDKEYNNNNNFTTSILSKAILGKMILGQE